MCGHNFHRHTFSTPHWCDVCGRFLWGIVMQGVKCRGVSVGVCVWVSCDLYPTHADCGMKVHRMCMTEGIYTCEEWRSRRAATISSKASRHLGPPLGVELGGRGEYYQSQKCMVDIQLVSWLRGWICMVCLHVCYSISHIHLSCMLGCVVKFLIFN